MNNVMAKQRPALEPRVVETKDHWNGTPVRQYDFLFSAAATPTDLGVDNVRVLVWVRRNCTPNVKWIWSGTRRQGRAEAAYRWLVNTLGSALNVHDVCGEESTAFHSRMKEKGLVARFTVDPVFRKDRTAKK